MRRKLHCLLLAVWVLLGSVCASAEGETGTVRVELGQKGKVALYRVGSFTEDGCRLLKTYGGGELSFDDLLSQDMAQWLAGKVVNGTTKKSEDGVVTFADVEVGIYLVVHKEAAEGYAPFAPFIITMPWDGDQWDIEAKPKITTEIPQTGDAALIPALAMLLSGSALAFLTGKRKARR